MTVPWACCAAVDLVVRRSTCPLIVSHALSVSMPSRATLRPSRINYYNVTIGAQQSVLGCDTLCLDSPKCMVLCLQSNAGYLKETNCE